MTDHDAEADSSTALGSVLDDPRVDPDHLRVIENEDSPIVLVGVVHDHPASIHRVRTVVEALEPATVGVELPPLALPLFEQCAADDDPTSGGEMSAALAANDARDAKAIDSLGSRFLCSLWGEIRRTSPSRSGLKRIAANALRVTRHAFSCRLTAVFGRDRLQSPIPDAPFEHDLDPSATPAELAENEERHLSRSFSILRAFERPEADEIVDAAREQTMATTLTELREEGPVVGVVGFEHLDGITDELTEADGDTRPVDESTLPE